MRQKTERGAVAFRERLLTKDAICIDIFSEPLMASPLPPTFSYRQARALGLSKRALYALRDSGEIESLSHGLYRRRDAANADEDLIEIARRSPNATLCLATALSRYDLSDEITAAPDLAIPRGSHAPATRAPVRWHRFDPDTFEIGRELLPIDPTTAIGLYSPERCIVDAFRMRGREGHEMANEALKRWLRRPRIQPAALLALAERFPRAATPLRRALEVLL